MKHLRINKKLCITCGLCKTVCVKDNIEIKKIAIELENNCFDCGQYSTLCPTEIITIITY